MITNHERFRAALPEGGMVGGRFDPQGEASGKAGSTDRFRRLKSSELVSRGDFSRDEYRGFEPWEGPTGFRADAFVKPIYRKQKRPLTKANHTT